jgi:hypothetical protein
MQLLLLLLDVDTCRYVLLLLLLLGWRLLGLQHAPAQNTQAAHSLPWLLLAVLLLLLLPVDIPLALLWHNRLLLLPRVMLLLLLPRRSLYTRYRSSS